MQAMLVMCSITAVQQRCLGGGSGCLLGGDGQLLTQMVLASSMEASSAPPCWEKSYK